ncbi:MAG: LSM domain-containing protein [Promethearchaeota archaeon]
MQRRPHSNPNLRQQRQLPNPIEQLQKSLNKTILLKVKKNRLFRGKLISCDNHLNLLLQDCVQIYEIENENGELVEEQEELGEILIRGDNVIFVEFGQ